MTAEFLFGKPPFYGGVTYGTDFKASVCVVFVSLQPQHHVPDGGNFQEGAETELLTGSILDQSSQVDFQK